MNTDEIESLSFYQGDGYQNINKLLRIPDKDTLFNHIKKIDKTLTNKHEGETVYRGIPNLSTLLKSTTEAGFNHTFIDHGYSSTTTNFCKSYSFLKAGTCCILAFTIPKGVKGFSFNEKDKTDFKNMNEDEILLERNLQYFLTEPVVINKLTVYPCIVKKYIPNVSEEDIKNALLVKENLVKMKDEIPKQTEDYIVDQIIEWIDKQPLKSTEKWNFDYAFQYLCLLDKSKKDKVYELFQERIKK
jgi:hypothetical protein